MSTDCNHPYGSAGSSVSESRNQPTVATLTRLRDQADVEACECDQDGHPRLAAYERGMSEGFRISLLVLAGLES